MKIEYDKYIVIGGNILHPDGDKRAEVWQREGIPRCLTKPWQPRPNSYFIC